MKFNSKNPALFQEIQLALERIKADVFEATLKAIGNAKYKSDPPPLGIPRATAEDEARRRKILENWLEIPSQFALTAANEAQYSAFINIFGNVDILVGISKFHLSQKQRLRSKKRVSKRGGRKATTPWRITARDLATKNQYLRKPSDMIAKLAAMHLISIEDNQIVILDDCGQPTKTIDRTEFSKQLSKLIRAL